MRMEEARFGKANVDGASRANREPRWPAVLALLAVCGLYSALPSSLVVGGPRWLLLAVVSVLLVPTVISSHKGDHFLNQVLGFILNGVITFAMIWSLALLITAVTRHKVTP